MALWIAFPALAAALFGTVVWVTAAGVGHQGRVRDLSVSKTRAWWRLVWPVFAGALVVAFLTGWALQEANPADEWVTLKVRALAGVVLAVVLRALLRALRSVRAARHAGGPIVTVGLLRCRTVISDAFEKAASPQVLAAALAHEAAHARYRDPVRIWMAQIATDLQWPMPRARRRFRNWVLALEMCRDDEAIDSGATPTALAESILLAARLHSGCATLSRAAVTGSGEGLVLRVRRLLSKPAVSGDGTMPRQRLTGLWCYAAIAVAGWLGALYGDALLMLLPGVGR